MLEKKHVTFQWSARRRARPRRDGLCPLLMLLASIATTQGCGDSYGRSKTAAHLRKIDSVIVSQSGGFGGPPGPNGRCSEKFRLEVGKSSSVEAVCVCTDWGTKRLFNRTKRDISPGEAQQILRLAEKVDIFSLADDLRTGCLDLPLIKVIATSDGEEKQVAWDSCYRKPPELADFIQLAQEIAEPLTPACDF